MPCPTPSLPSPSFIAGEANSQLHPSQLLMPHLSLPSEPLKGTASLREAPSASVRIHDAETPTGAGVLAMSTGC